MFEDSPHDEQPQAGQPPVGPRPPRLDRLATGFYAATLAAAFGWNLLAGRPWWQLFWDPGRATAGRALAGAALGLLLGLAVVGLSRWTVARFGWGRELYRWFASLLGPLRWRDALWLATLSSVAEETFFRGAMQPSLGLIWTSLAFGLMHLPPRLRLAPWTISALVLGLAFGALTLWSGCLAGAVVAHFVVNLLNLRHVGELCAAGD